MCVHMLCVCVQGCCLLPQPGFGTYFLCLESDFSEESPSDPAFALPLLWWVSNKHGCELDEREMVSPSMPLTHRNRGKKENWQGKHHINQAGAKINSL